jgi:DNA-binding MarR family transcriptional regulator
MEGMQLVTRTRSSTDERMVIIALTEKGRSLKIAAEVVDRKSQCQGILSAEEAKDLKKSLTKILNYFSN